MATATLTLKQLSSVDQVSVKERKEKISAKTIRLIEEPLHSKLHDANQTKDMQRLASLAMFDKNPDVIIAAVNRRVFSAAVLNATAQHINQLTKFNKPKLYRPAALAIMSAPNTNEKTFVLLSEFKDEVVQRALLEQKEIPKQARINAERYLEESNLASKYFSWLRIRSTVQNI